MKRLATVLILAILVFAAGPTLAGDYVLVVSPDHPESSLSPQEVKDLFLGRQVQWRSGAKVSLYVQAGSPLHSQFTVEAVGKTSNQYDMFWKKALFTGQGIPPTNLIGDTAVKKAVAQDRSAIGYIAAESVDSSVKVLTVR